MPVNNADMDKTTSRNDTTQTRRHSDPSAGAATTQPRQFFRASSRVFCLNGEWYFQTREDDHGPFTRREAAEHALERYVEDMQDFEGVNPDDSAIDLHAWEPASLQESA